MNNVLGSRLSVAEEILGSEAAAVIADWRELCSWDPALPPGTRPPTAEPMVGAVIDALRRPQPLGWGIDDQLELAVAELAELAGAVSVAVGELICLREALARRLRERLPLAEVEEFYSRLQMV